MPQSAAPNPQANADRLEIATDQAIAACDGDVRVAVKALIIANCGRRSQMGTREASSNRCRAIARIGTTDLRAVATGEIP
jgi:hypothetical protein